MKLRGLRIELGEIEHHLAVHPLIRHAVVLLPKSGLCVQKLVAVACLENFASQNNAGQVTIIGDDKRADADSQLLEIREHLATVVPSYMVPAIWVVVERIPLLPSGKLDRSTLTKWLLSMDSETYGRLLGVALDEAGSASSSTDTEDLLRNVYSRSLNLGIEQISLDRSFLSLGGDSISAMQVVGRCRAEGLAVTIRDVLRCKSITELAQLAITTVGSAISKEEVYDTPFKLSPVQQMYFELLPDVPVDDTNQRYNQSFFLKLVKATTSESVAVAVQKIVIQHSMLRARFSRDEDGKWSQKVLQDAENSFAFKSYEIETFDNIIPHHNRAQSSLNICRGPVFSAELYNLANGQQYILLVAHHAVVDLVSWRVIMQDLEEIIGGANSLRSKPLPYQNWLELQSEYAQQHLNPSKVLPFEVSAPDFAFWEMNGAPNTTKDTMETLIFISPEMTQRLLGNEPHQALRTEPIDLMLAAIMHSFGETFKDRTPATIFREGHGREPWSDDIDLSETVGWFTTMFPLQIMLDSKNDIVEFVRRVKDVRRSVPSNGWPYFASRYLNPKGIKAFSKHTQVEMTFDYLGLYQQLERDDALLRIEPRSGKQWLTDVGDGLTRFMLVEITAEVVQGRLRFSFIYNKHMRHQEAIQAWISQCEHSLNSAVEHLISMDTEFTLSDFPLLSLTYPALEELLSMRLVEVGFENSEDLQDAYPCSPMQRGLLLAQELNSETYLYSQTVEAFAPNGGKINVQRLQDAWRTVVQRHDALRTVFLESADGEQVYNQFVHRQLQPRVLVLESSDQDAVSTLSELKSIGFHGKDSLHRLSICETDSDRVYLKLELNHAIIDGGSLPVILYDLMLAYEERLPEGMVASYKDYITHVQTLDTESALEYWVDYLTGAEPCYITSASAKVAEEDKYETFKFQLGESAEGLRAFCEEFGVTISDLLRLAWGLVLRAFTGNDDVCFGYMSSGRDIPVAGIEEIVGPCLAMLVCRLDLWEDANIQQIMEAVQESFTRSLAHQFCSLADIQHALKLGSKGPLFNSMLSFQKDPNDYLTGSSILNFKRVQEYDPVEVRLAISSHDDMPFSDERHSTILL